MDGELEAMKEILETLHYIFYLVPPILFVLLNTILCPCSATNAKC